ncbi:MAG: outer membrane beta-barrel protein [Flavobacterium sp.]
MKKIITILFISVGFICTAQENHKFQVGLSYALTNSNDIYNTPFSGYAGYQVNRWENLDVNAGMRAFYYKSKMRDNFSNRWGFNPNVSTSYHFLNNKLNTYLAVGYYFDYFTFRTTPDPFFDPLKIEYKTTGVTITPGVKYFVFSNFFIDANLSLLYAKSKSMNTDNSNNTFLNIGIGVAF